MRLGRLGAKGSLPPLTRWLKWMDVFLGSLLSSVGVGQAVTELKGGVEAELSGAGQSLSTWKHSSS
jgi:hypothetical protein